MSRLLTGAQHPSSQTECARTAKAAFGAIAMSGSNGGDDAAGAHPDVVRVAGLEPALLSEQDFESDRNTIMILKLLIFYYVSECVR
ncbi:hypothetical protein D3C72_288490 [compost metagenome]